MRPEDWPWSSHAATLRGEAPPWLDVQRLLGFFALWRLLAGGFAIGDEVKITIEVEGTAS